MLSVLEYSSVPPAIIQMVFGQEVKSLYAVKVLLCKAIEERNRMMGRPVRQSADSLFIDERSRSSRPTSAISRRVTTPQPLLEILEAVEPAKRKPKIVNWKKVDSFAVESQQRKQRDEVDRRELLGSILLAKKLGISPAM
jgi:hypothetical protein